MTGVSFSPEERIPCTWMLATNAAVVALPYPGAKCRIPVEALASVVRASGRRPSTGGIVAALEEFVQGGECDGLGQRTAEAGRKRRVG